MAKKVKTRGKNSKRENFLQISGVNLRLENVPKNSSKN